MHLGIKGKQVLGVTAIVGVVVVALSLLQLARLAQVNLQESQARAELLANAVYHRAREVVADGAVDPVPALRADPGLRSILELSYYSRNVTFSAIVDLYGFAVAHADRSREGQRLVDAADLTPFVQRSALDQLFRIYFEQGRNLEFRQPLLIAGKEFGSIRVGVSTLLVRKDLDASLGPAAATAVLALAVAVVGAMLLAQIMLRPIHVIKSGLTRLRKGEFGVKLELDQQDEFGELGTFFNEMSAQLSADRSHMAGQVAKLESAVDKLEDAVAIVSPTDSLLFVNPAMRVLLPGATAGATLAGLLPDQHPARQILEQSRTTRRSLGPLSVTFAEDSSDAAGERLVTSHPVNDSSGQFVGTMLVFRNIQYLSEVQSTVRYSRKLAALGRLSAGVAHEVKNPLNAMMIHLELLRQQFAPTSVARRGAAGATTAIMPPPLDSAKALRHVDVIADEIRRLDDVVQGFLKFTRSEDLTLQPVALVSLFNEIAPIVEPEARRTGVQLVVACEGAPDVNGDLAMLRQAFLNLALNACQAMPNGGSLRIAVEAARGRRVLVTVSDTGVGIKPEDLGRIFDLYFTTRAKGSGIGLSMVYRTVQMHDGEIEVQSTVGKGTTFRVLLPQA